MFANSVVFRSVSRWWATGPAAYGIPDATTSDAITLAARLERFALDLVYAGKGVAGLIGLARNGRFGRDATVIWIHAGGVPGLFAYPVTMARASRRPT